MKKSIIKKVWGIPVLLAGMILFGLLAALLGTGYWYGLSWVAMGIPLLILLWKIWGNRLSYHKE